MSAAYHVTLEKKLGAIAIQGLQASKTWGRIWFSLNPFDYPPMEYCHGALLRFPLPEKYSYDEQGSMDTEEYFAETSIHPGAIGILVTDKKWISLESFMESDEKPFQFKTIEELERAKIS